MKKVFIALILACSLSGCVLEEDYYIATRQNGCSVVDYDYSYTEFTCRNHSVSYVFCDPYGETQRPNCWWPEEVPETYSDRCISINICNGVW